MLLVDVGSPVLAGRPWLAARPPGCGAASAGAAAIVTARPVAAVTATRVMTRAIAPLCTA
jgi:hypothetical protein